MRNKKLTAYVITQKSSTTVTTAYVIITAYVIFNRLRNKKSTAYVIATVVHIDRDCCLGCPLQLGVTLGQLKKVKGEGRKVNLITQFLRNVGQILFILIGMFCLDVLFI